MFSVRPFLFGMCLLLCAPPLNLSAQVDRVREFSIGDTKKDIQHFYGVIQTALDDRDSTDHHVMVNAIFNLCLTHDLIRFDPRYSLGPQLPGLRSRVASQLKSIQKDLIRQWPERYQPAEDSQAGDDALATTTAGVDSIVSPGEQTARNQSADDLLQDFQLLLWQFTGGPSHMAVYTGNFGPDANGRELVELIQSTIAPLTWDVNGGTGHVHFYRPQCLLVVRAGSDVQDQVGGLIQQLRDNQ